MNVNFHSSQCSSVPSNFSGRARPFRSTIAAAGIPTRFGTYGAGGGTSGGGTTAAVIRSSK
eukprot:16442712-Heterocapsa_arctica.AAC.1